MGSGTMKIVLMPGLVFRRDLFFPNARALSGGGFENSVLDTKNLNLCGWLFFR